MLSYLPTSDVERYGVFAAMASVAAMIVATATGLARMWRGPLKGWEVPDQPAFTSKIVTLPSAFLIVAGFFYARPENVWLVLLVGGVLITITVIAGIIYSQQITRFRRYKKVVVGNAVTADVPVLAGDELTEWAKSEMRRHNLDDQGVFAGTPNEPYTPNLVWTPESRIRVFNRLTVLFLITLFCGTGALSWLAYAVEVKVTGKAASDVLNPSQIPTRNDQQN
jgi:hypothetical protein